MGSTIWKERIGSQGSKHLERISLRAHPFLNGTLCVGEQTESHKNYLPYQIKALDRLCVGWENGSERGFKTVSFNLNIL